MERGVGLFRTAHWFAKEHSSSAASHYVDIMISDTESLSGAKLGALFSDIESVIIHTGSIWKYNHKSDFAESADAFDKFFTQKLNDYSKSLNPKHSVIAKVAVIDVVSPHKANQV